MRHLFRFGIVPILLVAFLACDMEQELEQEIVGPEAGPKTAALTAEAEPETNEVIVIKGEEALLRRIEELKLSSPAFAAAAASIFDGPVTSGDRVVLKAPTPPNDEGCLTDMILPDEDSQAALSDVVPFDDLGALRSLRERIRAGAITGESERQNLPDTALLREGRVFIPFSYE
jgi:hypothetical protein